MGQKVLNVEVVCTTDDPVDDLAYHQQIAKQNIFTKVYPTFRPDALLLIQSDTFQSYLKKMATCVGFSIDNLDDPVQGEVVIVGKPIEGVTLKALSDSLSDEDKFAGASGILGDSLL